MTVELEEIHKLFHNSIRLLPESATFHLDNPILYVHITNEYDTTESQFAKEDGVWNTVYQHRKFSGITTVIVFRESVNQAKVSEILRGKAKDLVFGIDENGEFWKGLEKVIGEKEQLPMPLGLGFWDNCLRWYGASHTNTPIIWAGKVIPFEFVAGCTGKNDTNWAVEPGCCDDEYPSDDYYGKSSLSSTKNVIEFWSRAFKANQFTPTSIEEELRYARETNAMLNYKFTDREVRILARMNPERLRMNPRYQRNIETSRNPVPVNIEIAATSSKLPLFNYSRLSSGEQTSGVGCSSGESVSRAQFISMENLGPPFECDVWEVGPPLEAENYLHLADPFATEGRRRLVTYDELEMEEDTVNGTRKLMKKRTSLSNTEHTCDFGVKRQTNQENDLVVKESGIPKKSKSTTNDGGFHQPRSMAPVSDAHVCGVVSMSKHCFWDNEALYAILGKCFYFEDVLKEKRGCINPDTLRYGSSIYRAVVYFWDQSRVPNIEWKVLEKIKIDDPLVDIVILRLKWEDFALPVSDIDLSSIAVINDKEDMFYNYYCGVLGGRGPTNLFVIDGIVAYVGPSVGHPEYTGNLVTNEGYYQPLPGWTSPMLGKRLDLRTVFDQNTIYLRNSRCLLKMPDVLIVHQWGLHCEVSTKPMVWATYETLRKRLPQYTHLAIHLDLRGVCTPTNVVERLVPQVHEDLVLIKDHERRFGSYFASCEFYRTPATLIFVMGNLIYVGEQHITCNLEFFPNLINEALIKSEIQ